MSSRTAPLEARLPRQKGTIGRLATSAKDLPASFDTWRHGIAFVNSTVLTRAQPVDSYTTQAGSFECRPALWDCYPAPPSHTIAEFWPTVLAAVDGCDSFDSGQPEQAVRDAIDDWSGALAEYAWTGRAGTVSVGTPWDVPAQPALWDATVITPATAVAPVKGMQLMIAALRDGGYRGPVTFHVRDDAIPALLKSALIVRDGSTWRAGDHTVIADPGYGRRIEASDPAAGTAWMVATGPMFAAVAEPQEIVPYDPAGNGWKCTLEEYFLGRRLGIVAWDTSIMSRALLTIDA